MHPLVSPVLLAGAAATILAAPRSAQEPRAMTFEDVMKFERIVGSGISPAGNAVVYEVAPDRGDGYAIVQDLERGVDHRVERGTRPRLNKSGTWAAVLVKPPAFFDGPDDEKPEQGLVLLELATGRRTVWLDVRSVAFSECGAFAAWHHGRGDDAPKTRRRTGGPAKVWRLGSEDTPLVFDNAIDFAFHPESESLEVSVATADGAGNGLFRCDLATMDGPEAVLTRPGHVVTRMAWNETGTHLAAVQAAQDDRGIFGDADLMLIDGDERRRIAWTGALGPDWVFPDNAPLSWSEDGRTLVTGFAKRAMVDVVRSLAEDKAKAEKDEGPAPDPFDLEAIVDDRKLDVWHWDDDLISPHQKNQWGRESRRTHAVAWNRDRGLVAWTTPDVPDVSWDGEAARAVGTNPDPYSKEMTWDGRYRDVYLVDPNTGEHQLVLARQGGTTSLSPDGRFLVYWLGGDWRVFDAESGLYTNLTDEVAAPFANEDHDYPSAVPSYGVAGWHESGNAVYIHDKFDLWRFELGVENAAGFTARCVTNGLGRENERVFRIIDLDPEEDHIPDGPLLLSSYHDRRKNWGFWELGEGRLRPLLETDHKYTVRGASEDGEMILFSRESYREFPDLWVTSRDFPDSMPVRVSELGRQTEPFAWGTAELVEWHSLDGTPLQGVLIKPEGHVAGEPLPVLVYYYRFFSQRLHEFNEVVVNHRPCFPYYASNGYCVFLPDIRFDVGNPGFAATKCLVPGVQKLVDLGVADPDAIALHGHSWSGYQTAHVITQTDVFACAVAGAPVSNMTSAYGGIRWGSGMSRQFQYEKTQSRIGASLWDRRDLYIDNSPVFFADRIETPLLIQFGDEDGAVPWYQGIELYMAMRRLNKECVFLQYRGEPHHLQQYPNKVDYSIKMHQWLDHFCKGEPAPRWIEEGAPYRGR